MDNCAINSKMITLSDSHFHRKIMNKHQMDKNNYFRFPTMIFYKNKRHISSQKINIHIALKNRQEIKSLVYSQIANMNNSLTELFKPLFSALNTSFCPQATCNVYLFNRAFSSQLLNNHIRVGKSQIWRFISNLIPESRIYHISAQKKNSLKRHIVFDKKPNLMQLQNNPLLNISTPTSINNFFSNTNFQYLDALDTYVDNLYFPNQQKIEKDIIFDKKSNLMPLQNNPLLNISTPTSINNFFSNTNFQHLDALDTYVDNLYFHNHRKIEKDIEQIKKTVSETKESIIENSMSTQSTKEIDINRHLDINHISDQVYHNIERRIRIEKDRRGL